METEKKELSFHIIAHIHNGFSGKFGIPRQSSLVEGITSRIIFEKEYRDPNAFRGITEYSHLWLIWEFSENHKREQDSSQSNPAGTGKKEWSPTVKPPRLGGNTRMGVFATRSPFRPNPIGLSSVRLESLEITKEDGPVLVVTGADLMDGTPILDIKPYLPFTDSHPEALGGFADVVEKARLNVTFPKELLELLPERDQRVVPDILAGDPRPAYQDDPERIYGMEFDGFDIRFQVRGRELIVCEVR